MRWVGEMESQGEEKGKGWRDLKVDPWVVDDVRAFFVCLHRPLRHAVDFVFRPMDPIAIKRKPHFYFRFAFVGTDHGDRECREAQEYHNQDANRPEPLHLACS